MAYEKKTTHVAEAIRDLIDAFQDKTKVTGLLTAYVNRIQDLENVFSDILTKYALSTATGDQLDVIGSIVGEARNGRDDLQYATAINARILLLRSEGTAEDMIDIVSAIVGPLQIVLTDYYPGKFLLTIDDGIDPNDVDVAAMGRLISSGKPAGVGMLLIYSISPTPLRFDTAGHGFDQGGFATLEIY